MILRYSKITLFIVIAGIVLSSCGRDNAGQLVGAQDRPKWKGPVNPVGMVYVPSGFLTIGQSDQDIFSSYTQRQKTVSMTGFYMTRPKSLITNTVSMSIG